MPVPTARAGAVPARPRSASRSSGPTARDAPGEDPNQQAIVLLVSYGELDVLLTADAETDVTTPLLLPPVEILKVAHHGSADPRLADVARARSARAVAVISVGAGNDYGHPTRRRRSRR